jgi:putative restriction endonuclease
MWSPKLKKNLTRNPNYDFMTEATLGDLVFSFAQRKIVAVGVATSAVYSSPKTKGFGSAVGARSDEGWRVDAGFQRLDAPFGARKPHGSDSATTAPKVPAAKDQGHH